MSGAPTRLFRAAPILLQAAKSATAKQVSSTAASTKKVASASTAAASKSKSKATVAKKSDTPTIKIPNSGLLKPLRVSPALGDFLGVSETSRPAAVKKIWDYIKLHNLQNPANKKEVYCDDNLKPLFEGKEKFNFLEVGKMLSRHLSKTSV